MRDFGPNFVVSKISKKIMIFDWNFWGYIWNVDSLDLSDGKIGESASSHLNIPFEKVSLVSEGGDREFNGLGTLITCEAVELQRNPNMKKEEIEKK